MSAEMLELAASALGPLLHEVVFLGGASVHLWISDPAAPPSRATDDVDVVSATTTRPDYYKLSERLRERGFSEASDSPVICRWNHKETGLVLDVMPQDASVLGFSNPWHQHVLETAAERELPSGTRIRAATPPGIIATKLAAWNGRGNGDPLRSLDLHDVLVLIDGREELGAEISAESPVLRKYVADQLAAIAKDPYFSDLAESAMFGYGALGASRAEQLQDAVKSLISANR
jgi:Nucleotidyl transferase AbiEii toxin, Type IV TA system